MSHIQFYYTKTECYEKQGPYDPDKHILLACDVKANEGIKMYSLLSKNDDLETIIDDTPIEDRNYYIVIPTAETIQKLKFDVDCCKDDKTSEEWDDLTQNLKRNILIAIKQTLYDVYGIGPSEDKYRFSIDNSSTDKKLSYHIVFQDRFVANCYEAKQFTEILRKNEHWANYVKYVDLAVYSSFQNWRLRGCCKKGKDNYKRREMGDFTSSLPIPVFGTANFYILKSICSDSCNDESKSTDVDYPTPNQDDVSDLIGMIYDMVMQGSHSLCDTEYPTKMCYDKWKNLAFAVVKSVSLLESNNKDKENLKTIHLKKIFELYRHNEDISNPSKFLENLSGYDNYNIGMGSLHYWARENPKYKLRFRKISEICIEMEEEYTWLEFRREMDITFDTYDALKEAFLKNVSRVIAKIEHGKGVFMKKDTFGFGERLTMLDAQKKFTDLKLSYKFLDEKEREKVKKVSFNDVFTDLSKSLKLFSTFCFKPIPYQDKSEAKPNQTEFNTWTGFKGLNVKDADFTPLNQFLDFIKDVWADGNQEYYDYIIDWWARKIQHPDQQAQISLIVCSEPGAGKNTVTDFMSEYVIGGKYCMSTAGLGKGTQKHNSMIAEKLLWVVNEMCSDPTNFLSDFENLKNIIDARDITIEPKGIDPYKICNFIDIIIFSNHTTGFVIEDKDRRYAPFRGSSKYIGNFEFFAEFKEKYFNQKMGNLMYTYLLQRDITKRQLRDIPMTELKEEMIKNSLNSSKDFIKNYLFELKNSDGLYPINGVELQDEKSIIQASRLYSIYVDWCDENGFKRVNNNKFSIAVKPYIEKVKGRQCNYYVLP